MPKPFAAKDTELSAEAANKKPGPKPGLRALRRGRSACFGDEDLHAAVLGAAVGRVVRGDRLARAAAIDGDAVHCNAAVDEVIARTRRTIDRQRIVDGV